MTTRVWGSMSSHILKMVLLKLNNSTREKKGGGGEGGLFWRKEFENFSKTNSSFGQLVTF